MPHYPKVSHHPLLKESATHCARDVEASNRAADHVDVFILILYLYHHSLDQVGILAGGVS